MSLYSSPVFSLEPDPHISASSLQHPILASKYRTRVSGCDVPTLSEGTEVPTLRKSRSKLKFEDTYQAGTNTGTYLFL